MGLKGHRRRPPFAHADRDPKFHDDPAGPSPAQRNQSRNVSKLGRNPGHFRLRSLVVVNAPLTPRPRRGRWQSVEQQRAFHTTLGLCALDRQKPKFRHHPSRGGKAPRLAASRQYPMAGHDDRAGILRQGLRDVAGQIAVAETLGDFAVGKRRAGGDAADDLVNASMELRHRIEIDPHMIQISALAAEQRNNIVDGALHVGRRFAFVRRGKAPQQAVARRGLAPFGQLHASNAALAPHDAAAPDRGFEKDEVHHATIANA